MSGLNELYKGQNDPSCNVTLEIDGIEVLKAHGIILAINSAYFETALRSIHHPQCNTIFDLDSKIIKFSRNVLLEIVNYMYTGVIAIEKENLEAAKFLDCKELVTFLEERFKENQDSTVQDDPCVEKIRQIGSVGQKAAVTLEIGEDTLFLNIHDAKQIINFMYCGKLTNLNKNRLQLLRISSEKLKYLTLAQLITMMLKKIETKEQEYRKITKRKVISEEKMIEVDLQDEYAMVYNGYVKGPSRKRKTKLVEIQDSGEGTSNSCEGNNDIEQQEEVTKNPLKCSKCDQLFETKEAQESHERTIHSVDLPYVCAVCGIGFKVQSNFARHRRSHTGEKPYECKQCGATYADKKYMDRHILREHFNATEILCAAPGCRSKFWRNDRYLIHYKNNHGGFPNNLYG
ncbi:unnamed protein product [Caenorhabditis bovis]|uniref:BTB domain-containing protein n=1 Tax=Caenorhabditis bovis TaxID=2654633 RepID=A0A8S1F8U2_9PELO|nr:unnamed protein product [Caenorhabditis bovis]